VEITERQVGLIVLVTINLVDWYLTAYLPQWPEAQGETAAPLVPPSQTLPGDASFPRGCAQLLSKRGGARTCWGL
jgi:hypothetical protein